MSETLTIAGKEFNAPAPYSEGHVISAGEAAALNQTFQENLRNNFAKRVKDAVEKGTFDQAMSQTEFDAYADKYEFGVRSGGTGGGVRAARDPVEKEAVRLATAFVEAKIKASGKTIGAKGNYTREQVKEVAAKSVGRFTDEARANVAKTQAQAASGSDDLDALLQAA